MYEYTSEHTCKLKVNVYVNKDGNILREDEQIAGEKTFTFGGFASSITAAETLNDEGSPAVHNGISGIIWLFTGRDEGMFDPLSVKKITTEEIDRE